MHNSLELILPPPPVVHPVPRVSAVEAPHYLQMLPPVSPAYRLIDLKAFYVVVNPVDDLVTSIHGPYASRENADNFLSARYREDADMEPLLSTVGGCDLLLLDLACETITEP